MALQFNNLKTRDGKLFERWASKGDLDDVKDVIVTEIEDVVKDEDSVTAIASEIASGKKAIAEAINTKGGSSTSSESFTELAEDITLIDWNPSVEYTWQNGIPLSVDEVYKRMSLDLIAIDDSTIVNSYRQFAFCYCLGLQSVRIRNYIGAANAEFNATFTIGNSALRVYQLDKATSFEYYFNYARPFANTSLLSIILPLCKTISIGQANNFKRIVVGLLTNCSISAASPDLIDFQIKENTDINMNISGWTATNVIAEGSDAITELNDNLYNNLLTKLYDHTNDGETRTLRIGWLANVSADNITYANNKGWTLTT